MSIYETARPDSKLFYLPCEDGCALPLLGSELRPPIAPGLLSRPFFRDDHGLLVVRAFTVQGPDGQPREERCYLRVL